MQLDHLQRIVLLRVSAALMLWLFGCGADEPEPPVIEIPTWSLTIERAGGGDIEYAPQPDDTTGALESSFHHASSFESPASGISVKCDAVRLYLAMRDALEMDESIRNMVPDPSGGDVVQISNEPPEDCIEERMSHDVRVISDIWTNYRAFVATNIAGVQRIDRPLADRTGENVAYSEFVVARIHTDSIVMHSRVAIGGELSEGTSIWNGTTVSPQHWLLGQQMAVACAFERRTESDHSMSQWATSRVRHLMHARGNMIYMGWEGGIRADNDDPALDTPALSAVSALNGWWTCVP